MALVCLRGDDKLNDFRLREIAQSASWLSPPETPETLPPDRAVMGKVPLADTIVSALRIPRWTRDVLASRRLSMGILSFFSSDWEMIKFDDGLSEEFVEVLL